ncbi:MAG: type II CAAX endopeptidase family protein [Halobacteria archaeon]|nr:type II CAAX endopeptidase family protein [Halobacteria archaeon]
MSENQNPEDEDVDDSDPDESLLLRGIVAFGLTLLANVVGGFLVAPAVLLGLGQDLLSVATVFTLAELGYAVAAVFFISANGLGRGYLRLSSSDWSRISKYIAGFGVVFASFSFITVASVNLAGISTLPSMAVKSPINPPTLFLMMIPLSIVVVAPAEELFFRGVLQTYIGKVTSSRNAVLVAGGLFALVHVPNYLALPSALAMVIMTTVIFVVGLGIGYAYESSDSLYVAIGVHAVYNSLVMAGWYVLVTQGVVSL